MRRKNDSESSAKNCMNKKNKSAQRGVSLLELVVVLAIMSVIVGLVAPAFVQQTAKKRKDSCRQNRTALLNIYARGLFDNSVPLELTNADLQLVLDPTIGAASLPAGAKKNAIEMMKGEVESGKYGTCPYANMAYLGHATAAVDTSHNTAYIYCPDCDDTVSLDLAAWKAMPRPSGTEKPIATPELVSPSPEPDIEWTVSFSNNGHGTVEPSPQKVKNGKSPTKPTDPTDMFYGFGGWYYEPACENKVKFNEKIYVDTTYFAKWAPIAQGGFWPYGDDPTWWESDAVIESEHPGATKEHHLTNETFNNKRLRLIGPSGIFSSRMGNYFVFVKKDEPNIYQYQASTPEYYAALHDNTSLIQLTGNRIVIEFKNSDSDVYVSRATDGDLVIFRDENGKEYMYVYWEQTNESMTVNISDIKKYDYKLGNMYRVNP